MEKSQNKKIKFLSLEDDKKNDDQKNEYNLYLISNQMVTNEQKLLDFISDKKNYI